MKAHEICSTAADLTGGERDRTHGSKLRNFQIIADYWSTFLRCRRDRMADLRPDEAAIMMQLMKVARTQHGAFNLDDYVDGAGYSACAGEIAHELDGGGANDFTR